MVENKELIDELFDVQGEVFTCWTLRFWFEYLMSGSLHVISSLHVFIFCILNFHLSPRRV